MRPSLSRRSASTLCTVLSRSSNLLSCLMAWNRRRRAEDRNSESPTRWRRHGERLLPTDVHRMFTLIRQQCFARRTCEKDLRGLGKQPGRYGRDRWSVLLCILCQSGVWNWGFFFLILHPTKRSQQEHCTCDGKAADVGSDSVTTCWDTRKQLKQEKKNPNLQEAGFCVKKLCFAALLMCSSAPPSVKRTHRAAAPYTLMTDWEQNTETCDVTRCKFL